MQPVSTSADHYEFLLPGDAKQVRLVSRAA